SRWTRAAEGREAAMRMRMASYRSLDIPTPPTRDPRDSNGRLQSYFADFADRTQTMRDASLTILRDESPDAVFFDLPGMAYMQVHRDASRALLQAVVT